MYILYYFTRICFRAFIMKASTRAVISPRHDGGTSSRRKILISLQIATDTRHTSNHSPPNAHTYSSRCIHIYMYGQISPPCAPGLVQCITRWVRLRRKIRYLWHIAAKTLFTTGQYSSWWMKGSPSIHPPSTVAAAAESSVNSIAPSVYRHDSSSTLLFPYLH